MQTEAFRVDWIIVPADSTLFRKSDLSATDVIIIIIIIINIIMFYKDDQIAKLILRFLLGYYYLH